MSTTRRMVLGAGLAAPLLAQFTGTASGTAGDTKWGTISEAWVEVRWTPQAQAQLDRFEAVVEAVAPAELVKDSSGSAVRFPVRSGTGDPSVPNLPKAQGRGVLDGGVAVRTPSGNLRLVNLEGVLQEGSASGKCVVNGVDSSRVRPCRVSWSAAAKLSASNRNARWLPGNSAYGRPRRCASRRAVRA